jgi:hypothetical protein
MSKKSYLSPQPSAVDRVDKNKNDTKSNLAGTEFEKSPKEKIKKARGRVDFNRVKNP